MGLPMPDARQSGAEEPTLAPSRLVIGLMSGTSADGIDAALVDISGSGEGTRARLEKFVFAPYPDDLRREVLAAGEGQSITTARLCRLNVVLGEWFARAALRVCEAAGVPIDRVRAVGSHGQTVHHLPDSVEAFGVTTRSTLQLGDPAVIAERTGVTTVSDFRSRDLAAGGQGAPLVPLVDYLLFRSDAAGRIMLNIGGIANLTVLPAGCGPGDVVAFDTGPGNMLIDALVGHLSSGAASYDEDGRMAAAGNVDRQLLKGLMAHPYLAIPPPKSTGREMFGESALAKLLATRGALSDADLVRTATVFTSECIADAVRRFVTPHWDIDELVVSGGGAENPILLEALRESLGELPVARLETLGVPSEAKEALAFAVLANETLHGRPGNVPGATGADGPRVLGLVAPGRSARISVD